MTALSPTLPRTRPTMLACCGAHMTHDGYSDTIPVLLPLWQIAFGLSLTEVGFLNTAFILALGFLQVPAGLLAERYGERIILVGGTALAGAGFIAFAYTNSYIALMAALFVAGMGAAVQHPLASALVSKAHEGSARRIAIGTYNFSGDLGKITFPILFAGLLTLGPWQMASTVIGGIGITVAALLYIALNRLNVGAAPVQQDPANPIAKTPGWGIVDQAGYSTLSAIFVIDTMVRVALVTLLPFLLISKGMAAQEVGWALALLFVGGAAGKFLAGRLAAILGIIPTVVVSELATVLGIIALAMSPLDTIYWLLPLVGVALNGTSSVLYGAVTDFTAEDRQARAFSLFYTLGVGASAAGPVLVGVTGDLIDVPTAVIIVGLAAGATLPLTAILRRCLIRVNALN